MFYATHIFYEQIGSISEINSVYCLLFKWVVDFNGTNNNNNNRKHHMIAPIFRCFCSGCFFRGPHIRSHSNLHIHISGGRSYTDRHMLFIAMHLNANCKH